MRSIFKPIFLLFFVVSLIGCGGSSDNPTKSNVDENEISDTSTLNVRLEASQTTVAPGQTVELTAHYEIPSNTQIKINWINVTGYGTLSNLDQKKITWRSPSALNTLESIEVINLVVTGIRRIVSPNGLDTRTQILTETKTILLTVVGN